VHGFAAPCGCSCFFRDNLTILGVAFFHGIGDDKTRDSGELPDRKEGETYEEKDCTYYFPFPLGQRMVSAVRAA
jgi:hypothetical protein